MDLHPPAPRLLDVPGAAAYLGLSRWAVYRLVESRAVPHVALGRRRLLDVQDLDAWIRRNKVRAARPRGPESDATEEGLESATPAGDNGALPVGPATPGRR